MALYTLQIKIEANSPQEAEQKLLQMQKIVSAHKKVTWNDVLCGVIEVCKTTSDAMEAVKLENLTRAYANTNTQGKTTGTASSK